MKLKKKLAVVIPEHRCSLHNNEVISIDRVVELFEYYDKFFVLPEDLEYDYSNEKIEEKRFEAEWFSSPAKYNELCLKPFFYEAFKEYEYILICQTDAFIFGGNIEEYCDMGYDYVGAPWLTGNIYQYSFSGKAVKHVGNGGLSLRNVESFLDWTRKAEFIEDIKIWPEDALIAQYGYDSLKIAPIDIAVGFSIESQISECIELNEESISFGCHAWEMCGFDFWKRHIVSLGYNVEDRKTPKLLLDYSRDISTMMFWEKKRSPQVFADTFYEEYKVCDKEIYIWAAGKCARMIFPLFVEGGINISGFVDNDTTLVNSHLRNKKIISADDFFNIDSKFVIVALFNDSDVVSQLQDHGYSFKNDYTTYTDLMNLIYKKL